MRFISMLLWVGMVLLLLGAAPPHSCAADVAVAWPPVDPSYQVQHYKVWCATNGTSNPGILALIAAPATNYSTALPNGAVYFISVSAVNIAGEGPRSTATATPPLPPAPSPPTVATSSSG